MRLKWIPVFVVGVVPLGILIALFANRDNGSITKESDTFQLSINEGFYQTEPTLNVEAMSVQGEKQKSSIGSPLFLGEECPERLDRSISLNTQCMNAINKYFRDQAAYTIDHFGMVPTVSSYTLGEIFDSHNLDRELVFQALKRAECRLLEGPIQIQQRAICNAHSLARFTHLSELCYKKSTSDHWFDLLSENLTSPYQNKMKRLEKYASDSDVRLSELNDLRESVLKDVWLKSQCPTYVSEGSLFSLEQDIEFTIWWNEEPSKLRRSQLSRFNYPFVVLDRMNLVPYERLALVSARLGDIRLISSQQLYRITAPHVDIEYKN